MAYPFHPLPTFAEFKETLREKYEVEYIEGCSVQRDGDPHSHVAWYFKRTVDGEPRVYVFELTDEELVEFAAIRSICKHLDIPFEKDALFGLHLG